MKKTQIKIARLALAVTLSALSGMAAAQSAGTWMVKGGVINISPQTKSGDLSAPSLAGTKTSVGDSTGVFGSVAYMMTDNVSLETFFGLPFRHDVSGAGAIAGSGKLGTVDQISPSLLLQYRFMDAKAAFRPRVSVGVTYAKFFRERGSAALTALLNPGGTAVTFKADSDVGPTAEVGFSYTLRDRWFLDASISKTFVSTTNTFSTGQTIKVKLDPLSVGASIGYRF
jgi:outer membrane protein